MAELTDILLSGDIADIKLGGTAPQDSINDKEFLELVPNAGTNVPNNSFWIRSTDNFLMFRDSGGADNIVMVNPVS
jgi:hypothetical protein